jgi:hypothetical protein
LLAGIEFDMRKETTYTKVIKKFMDEIREQGLGTQVVEKYCNIFFREVDKDGDGRISREEWMTFMSNQEARDAVQRDLLVEIQLLAKSIEPGLAAKVIETVKSYAPPPVAPYVPYVPPALRAPYVPTVKPTPTYVPARKTPKYVFTTTRPLYGDDMDDDGEYDLYDATDYSSSRRNDKKKYGFRSYSSSSYDDVECFDEW